SKRQKSNFGHRASCLDSKQQFQRIGYLEFSLSWRGCQQSQIASEYGAKLEEMSAARRREWVHDWLRNAVQFVRTLKTKGLVGSSTDTDHQKVWLDVFEDWRAYAKQ
ncbi:MAG: hypothetical protein ABSG27_16295, partial [Candidatus Acidiferrales bacterium]